MSTTNVRDLFFNADSEAPQKAAGRKPEQPSLTYTTILLKRNCVKMPKIISGIF